MKCRCAQIAYPDRIISVVLVKKTLSSVTLYLFHFLQKLSSHIIINHTFILAANMRTSITRVSILFHTTTPKTKHTEKLLLVLSQDTQNISVLPYRRTSRGKLKISKCKANWTNIKTFPFLFFLLHIHRCTILIYSPQFPAQNWRIQWRQLKLLTCVT